MKGIRKEYRKSIEKLNCFIKLFRTIFESRNQISIIKYPGNSGNYKVARLNLIKF